MSKRRVVVTGMREWPRDDAVAPLRALLAAAQPAFGDGEH